MGEPDDDTQGARSPGANAGLSAEETVAPAAREATPARGGTGRLSGSTLDQYRILERIGAGGFGEVYRARDTTLGRDVAIKVLPAEVASDAERLRRFEQEARAASGLNHPAIVTVYGIGSREGVSYIAMELVEGRMLRDLIGASGLPARRILEIAAQIADGLAKAHAAGIVHRDMKPENVMVSRDGFVKILDFGLAKLTQASPDSGGTMTGTGVVLGTVTYMSPEQAAGRPVDFRSDQFSFGSMLYEMATGRRPFTAPTAAQTLAAIIQDEPEPLQTANPKIPAPLRWVVERCLSKEADQRYASTRDLARDLATLRDRLTETLGAADASAPQPPRRRAARLALALGFAAALSAAVVATRRLTVAPVPAFQRLTFRRGAVGNALFAPDGRTIVYEATFDGRPSEIFTVRPESPESRSLGLPSGSELLSVSSTAEVAFFQGDAVWRVPLGGGAPKAWLTDVSAASWGPDGKEIAVVTHDEAVLELPPGKKLWESKRAVQALRFSPSGRHLAVAETNGGYGDTVFRILDRTGREVAATRRWRFGTGLAWKSDDELWFSAAENAFATSLWALDLSGRVRQVFRIPALLGITDASPDGRVLLGRSIATSQIAGRFPEDAAERDLSWLDFSYLNDVSPDGRTILFSEFGDAAGPKGAVYLRKTDGSAAVLLGEGSGINLSPDGRWALATSRSSEGLVVLPTGPGEPKTISLGDLENVRPEKATWFPDGSRIVVTGSEKGHKPRCWTVEISTGAIRPLTPEGIHGLWGNSPVSPDGRSLFVRDDRDEKSNPRPAGLFFPETGRFEPARGWKDDFNLHVANLRFSADGKGLLAHRHEGALPSITVPTPARTFLVRYDLAREVWERLREISLADPAAVWGSPEPVPAADGIHYAYFYRRVPTDLYLATGLK
jgi:eukaryotic-like serine/threonine-protein kinase